MKKACLFLATLLCLSLLAACGQEETGTWTPVEDYQFSWEYVLATEPDLHPFDTSVIHDPDHNYTHRGWLDENTALCTRSNAGSFSCYEMVAVTLDGQVTVLEADVHPQTMITAQNGLIAFGSYYETILDDVITFARWNGDETLTILYEFRDGISFHTTHFFSPDGTKAAIGWTPEAPSTQWQVRIVDLETGNFQDVTPPGLESEEPLLLLVRWQDDSTLFVTATDMLPDGYTAAWEYALP
jgi:hypothetical protein